MNTKIFITSKKFFNFSNIFHRSSILTKKILLIKCSKTIKQNEINWKWKSNEKTGKENRPSCFLKNFRKKLPDRFHFFCCKTVRKRRLDEYKREKKKRQDTCRNDDDKKKDERSSSSLLSIDGKKTIDICDIGRYTRISTSRHTALAEQEEEEEEKKGIWWKANWSINKSRSSFSVLFISLRRKESMFFLRFSNWNKFRIWRNTIEQRWTAFQLILKVEKCRFLFSNNFVEPFFPNIDTRRANWQKRSFLRRVHYD